MKSFQGFDYKTAQRFWNRILPAYAGTDDEAVLSSLSDRARIIGYTRLIRRSIRRNGLEDEERRAEIEHWREELIQLVDKVNVLSYRS